MPKAYVVNLDDRELVRGDLIERLQRLGADDTANLDRVEKYMQLWDLAAAYVKDRTRRGLYITTAAVAGEVKKLNPSAQELVKVLGQMDKLYGSIESAKPKPSLRDKDDDAL